MGTGLVAGAAPGNCKPPTPGAPVGTAERGGGSTDAAPASPMPVPWPMARPMEGPERAKADVEAAWAAAAAAWGEVTDARVSVFMPGASGRMPRALRVLSSAVSVDARGEGGEDDKQRGDESSSAQQH